MKIFRSHPLQNTIAAVLLLSVSIGVQAQEHDTTGLQKKQVELQQAKDALKKAEDDVLKIQSEVTALKPVEKWQTGGFQSINFNQVSLTNWSKGGQNSFAVSALGNLYASYKHDKWQWENNLDMAFGLLRTAEEDFKKNEDMMDLVTKVGRKLTNKINLAAGLRFESQFAPGYNDQAPDTNSPMISKFLAPGYMKAFISIDYKPTPNLSIIISPAASKFTFVMDEDIAARNIYIPESSPDNQLRSEFGALLYLIYQNKEVVKNIGLRSSIELFNNYTDQNKPNRKNIDVDWQTSIHLKIGKYLGANMFTHLLYDNDTKFIEYTSDDIPVEGGARVQFKEVLGFGFSYKF